MARCQAAPPPPPGPPCRRALKALTEQWTAPVCRLRLSGSRQAASGTRPLWEAFSGSVRAHELSVKAGVHAGDGEERVVRAALDNAALVQDEHLVGVADRAQ